MKVAVIGANGQLGSDLVQEFKNDGNEVFGFNHCDVEVYDIDSIYNIIKLSKPDLLINTSAYHNVEKCEENPLRSFQINAIGARNLAIACSENDITLMHISTDYVFDGRQKFPYFETDCPNPLSVYGNSKLAGENFIRNIAKRFLIIRTSGLYGKRPCRAKGGMNFVQLMLKLASEGKKIRVVDNEILTPTPTIELARQLVRIKEPDFYGVVHASSQCFCSWYQFAKAIFSISKLEPDLQIASPDEFPSKAKRPEYSVLENGVLNDYNVNIMKTWEQGLKEYLLS